jgi:azurin
MARFARQALVGVASASVAIGSAAAQPGEVATIEIQVADNMRFTPAVINARPGGRLRIVLKNTGKLPKTAMAHNFVLLTRGTNPKSFVDKSSAAQETGFIVPALREQVIAATALVGSGETGEVTFDAPAEAGEYVFVCTFPGHFNLGMKGLLIVK